MTPLAAPQARNLSRSGRYPPAKRAARWTYLVGLGSSLGPSAREGRRSPPAAARSAARRARPPFLVRIVTIPTRSPNDTASRPSLARRECSQIRTIKRRFGSNATATPSNVGACRAGLKRSRRFTCDSMSPHSSSIGGANTACSLRSRTRRICIRPNLPGAGITTSAVTALGSPVLSASSNRKSRVVLIIICLLPSSGTPDLSPSTGRHSTNARRNVERMDPPQNSVSYGRGTRLVRLRSWWVCGHSSEKYCRDMVWDERSCFHFVKAKKQFPSMSENTSRLALPCESTRGRGADAWSSIGAQRKRGSAARESLRGIPQVRRLGEHASVRLVTLLELTIWKGLSVASDADGLITCERPSLAAR